MEQEPPSVAPLGAAEIDRRERTVTAWERIANALDRIAHSFEEVIDEIATAATAATTAGESAANVSTGEGSSASLRTLDD